MRTLKFLVAGFGALLLIASSATAAVIFTVSAPAPGADGDSAQEVDVSLTLTGGSGALIVAFSYDWLLNGAAVPLSAVQLPAGGAPSGPQINPAGCASVNNQFMCNFDSNRGSSVGSAGSNDVGDNWLWDFNAPLDGTYNLGRFTFTDLAAGEVSIGGCEIYDGSFNQVPCSSNSVPLNPIPEPTTAALLGLGLAGLVVGGRGARRR